MRWTFVVEITATPFHLCSLSSIESSKCLVLQARTSSTWPFLVCSRSNPISILLTTVLFCFLCTVQKTLILTLYTYGICYQDLTGSPGMAVTRCAAETVAISGFKYHLFCSLSGSQNLKFVWSATAMDIYWKGNETVSGEGKFPSSPTTLRNCFPLNCFRRVSTTISCKTSIVQNVVSRNINMFSFYVTVTKSTLLMNLYVWTHVTSDSGFCKMWFFFFLYF